jgi:hypothetical protein
MCSVCWHVLSMSWHVLMFPKHALVCMSWQALVCMSWQALVCPKRCRGMFWCVLNTCPGMLWCVLNTCPGMLWCVFPVLACSCPTRMQSLALQTGMHVHLSKTRGGEGLVPSDKHPHQECIRLVVRVHCQSPCTKQYSVVQCRVFSPQSMHFPIVRCAVDIRFAA